VTVDIPKTDLHSRARVERVAPTRIGTVKKAVGSSTTATVGRTATLMSRYAATEDAWAEVPMSARECLEYTRSGDWVPGEQFAWLEGLGKAYGYCVALPVTLLGLLVVATFQKPTRLLLTALVVGVGWWAAGMALAGVS
jgi:hypothetical protein